VGSGVILKFHLEVFWVVGYQRFGGPRWRQHGPLKCW